MLVSDHHPECYLFTIQIKVTLKTFNFPGTLWPHVTRRKKLAKPGKFSLDYWEFSLIISYYENLTILLNSYLRKEQKDFRIIIVFKMNLSLQLIQLNVDVWSLLSRSLLKKMLFSTRYIGNTLVKALMGKKIKRNQYKV